MAEKKRYGMLEMDDEQKKHFDKLIVKKNFTKLDPELNAMIMGARKGMPPIIDIHTHPYTKTGWRSLGKFRVHLEKYLYGKKDITPEEISASLPSEEEWVKPFQELGVKVLPCGWAAQTTMGDDPLYADNTNDEIAAMRDKWPDTVISGWGSVDPWQGYKAIKEAERCCKELKLVGLKFQQVGQAFHVNDRQFYPLWDACQELGMPIQLHTGFTGLGSGAPGALGTKIKYTMQLIPDIDDISADFPNLKIIMLHCSDGRDEDAVLLCRHKGNIFRELSGIWPNYLPENAPKTVYEANRRQKDKYMFGSEFNLFPLDGIIYQHLQFGWREGVLESMFWKNTVRILGPELERAGVNLKQWKVGNLEEV